MQKLIISLLFSTLIFSVTETEKINLSEQFSKINPQEKRVVQKSLESKNVDKAIAEKRITQKNDIFKVHASENFEKRTIQKINKLSKNKGIIETKGREECPEGTVDDCSGDGDCCPEEWIGDGYSDCEDQEYGCDLTCYENDGGDCDSDGRGDVSLDREINVLDVVSLTGFVINTNQPTNNQFWAGDINQDRTLDVLDIVLLIDIIFQN